MSFFIRNNKGNPVNGIKKRKNQFVAHSSDNKRKKNKKQPRIANPSEEIPSDDEDQEFDHEDDSVDHVDMEDVNETAQEKKLKLAKKYLEEIEREERERLEADEVDDDVILNRLRDDVLLEAGKLRKCISDKIKTEFEDRDVCVLRCKQHSLPVTCVVVSSDSKYLYTGSKDSTIVKWSLVELKKINHIPSRYKDKSNSNLHDSSVLSLALSHNNLYLASCDISNIIRIWNADSLAFMFIFTGHRQQVTGVVFCRYSDTLYSCSKDRTVKIWSLNDRAYIETLFGHQAAVTDIDCLSKDRVVTSGGIDNSVRVWKIQEESQLIYNANVRHIDSVKKINEKNFVSCGEDGTVCLWGISRKKPLKTVVSAHGIDSVSGEPNWITSVGTLFNSEMFATGSCDGLVRIWKSSDNFKNCQVHSEVKVKGFINSICFTPDEKRLILGVGQEHKLGRWSKIKEAQNSIVIVNIEKV